MRLEAAALTVTVHSDQCGLFSIATAINTSHSVPLSLDKVVESVIALQIRNDTFFILIFIDFSLLFAFIVLIFRFSAFCVFFLLVLI